MAIVDVKLSLPFTLVALVVIAFAGNGIGVLIAVLGIAYWAHFARLVRAQVMALRELPYVEAARATGASGWRMAVVHMLPNIVSPVLVMTTLNFSNLILLEFGAVLPRPGRAAADGDARFDGGAGARLHGLGGHGSWRHRRG